MKKFFVMMMPLVLCVLNLKAQESFLLPEKKGTLTPTQFQEKLKNFLAGVEDSYFNKGSKGLYKFTLFVMNGDDTASAKTKAINSFYDADAIKIVEMLTPQEVSSELFYKKHFTTEITSNGVNRVEPKNHPSKEWVLVGKENPYFGGISVWCGNIAPKKKTLENVTTTVKTQEVTTPKGDKIVINTNLTVNVPVNVSNTTTNTITNTNTNTNKVIALGEIPKPTQPKIVYQQQPEILYQQQPQIVYQQAACQPAYQNCGYGGTTTVVYQQPRTSLLDVVAIGLLSGLGRQQVQQQPVYSGYNQPRYYDNGGGGTRVNSIQGGVQIPSGFSGMPVNNQVATGRGAVRL